MGKAKKEYRRVANSSEELKQFIDFAADLTSKLRKAIIVDQVIHSFEDREELLDLLREHIANHVVKIGKSFYRQTIGIPQGSIVSTLLCR